jgi:hypothetical protein
MKSLIIILSFLGLNQIGHAQVNDSKALIGNWKLKEVKCQSGKPLKNTIKQNIGDEKDVPVGVELGGSVNFNDKTVEVKSIVTLRAPRQATRICTITDIKEYSVNQNELLMKTISSSQVCSGNSEPQPAPAAKSESRSNFQVQANALTITNPPLDEEALCEKGDQMISVFSK